MKSNNGCKESRLADYRKRPDITGYYRNNKGEPKTKVKKFLRVTLPILAILIMTLVITGTVMAADPPTTTTITWNGAGTIGTTVDSGHSNAGFVTSGSFINGSFTATDSNNNPYSYGVDNFASYLNASVTDGSISTGMARVASYVPMYGNGGQVDSAFVGVNGGTASMAFRSTTNYAALINASYTYQLPGGHNIVVTGGDYTIDRAIADGRGNSGEFFALGNGGATLDAMSSEASGVWNLTLGRGAGCYTDANYNATGSGHVAVTGIGVNGVTFNGMGVSAGGGTLQFIADWVGNINIADYSLTAH